MMFFSISNQRDERLPLHTILGQWIISHDKGWMISEHSMRKGLDINWTNIKIENGEIVLEHDDPRSYPLWWNRDSQMLTNFLGNGEIVCSDKRVKISTSGLVTQMHNIYPDIDTTKILSLEQCADFIINILLNQLDLLSCCNIPKKLFVSGGVDTVLLFSLIRNQKRDDVEILNYEYFQHDWFTNKHYYQLKQNHWAYDQIHHWCDPTILFTGGSGDEFMMRGPTTLALWAAWHDIDLVQMLGKNQGYHVGYFLKPKNLKIFNEFYTKKIEIKEKYPSKIELLHQILNMNANDYQHWHLGETLCWTPFKNLEITRSVLALDHDSMMSQIFDAHLNKIIIEKLYPTASALISTTKNQNTRENLETLMCL